jgi:hypothetical protein
MSAFTRGSVILLEFSWPSVTIITSVWRPASDSAASKMRDRSDGVAQRVPPRGPVQFGRPH